MVFLSWRDASSPFFFLARGRAPHFPTGPSGVRPTQISVLPHPPLPSSSYFYYFPCSRFLVLPPTSRTVHFLPTRTPNSATREASDQQAVTTRFAGARPPVASTAAIANRFHYSRRTTIDSVSAIHTCRVKWLLVLIFVLTMSASTLHQ